MKNNKKISLVILGILFLFTFTPMFAFADNSFGTISDFISGMKDGSKNADADGETDGIFNNLQHPDAPAGYEAPGADKVLSPIYFGIDLFRYFISSIAILIIVIEGAGLIFSSDEESGENAKKTITYAVIGLIVIQLASIVVKKMFFGEHGEVLADTASAKLFAGEASGIMRNILGFLEFVMGTFAVLVIVWSGFKIAKSAGDEEDMKNAKKHIGYGVLGLFVIILSEVVVRGVLFPDNGEKLPSGENATYIILGIINYISTFTGIIAFIMLFYAGYLYVVDGGNDDAVGKVKSIFIGAVLGILLSLGSYAIVNTMLDFNKVDENSTATTEINTN